MIASFTVAIPSLNRVFFISKNTLSEITRNGYFFWFNATISDILKIAITKGRVLLRGNPSTVMVPIRHMAVSNDAAHISLCRLAKMR